MRKIKQYLSLVVFAHTVFALPFAFIAFTMACIAVPPERPLVLLVQVLVCMVTARNSAMSFNRYADRFIDAQNQRTKGRELPSGALSPQSAISFFMVNVLTFLTCCLTISWLCFFLAFPALVLLCGYSYTKRFTWLCHFVLGCALAVAPAGAYIAVTGTLSLSVCLLSVIVWLWVSGFDILYALPDEEHDRTHGLHAIPQQFGRKAALRSSAALHFLVVPLLLLFGLRLHLSYGYWVAALIFAALLVYQHAIVKANDISRLNRAFFTANGVASILFAVLTVIDMAVW